MLYIRRVTGASMAPTLRNGQIVLLWSARSQYAVGDIVMFHHRDIEKIKRITDMRDGNLYVVGDNQAASTDSRHFGWIRLDTVLGRVIWPLQSRLFNRGRQAM